MFTKLFRNVSLVLALGALAVALSPNSQAAVQDDWNKRTVITVNRSIEVPGKVIPPGKYILEIVSLQAERNVVRISDEAGKIYATVIAIPNYTLEAKENTVLTYYEAPRGAPEPLRAWFYPGNRIGVEFVYPKKRATEIAAASSQRVIAENVPPVAAAAPAPTVAELLKEPLVAIAPSGKEEPLAAVRPPEAAAPAPAPARAAAPPPPPPPAATAEPALPKTASPLPLIGLIGLISAAAASAVRLYRR